MSCTKHFLGWQWEHHRWRKHVTSAENAPQHETNMWGRPINGEFTHCIKHDVCEVCGKTRQDINCLCDCDVAEHCEIRREWISQAHKAAP